MLRGINAITIDGKGRLALPARYRDEFIARDQSSFVLTIDTEETCLLLYPTTEWLLIENKLQGLPSFNPMARRIQRLLIGHATDVELDGNGRILLTPPLREHAQLDKKVVMIGQGNKFEVWNEALWQEKCKQWLIEEAAAKGGLPEEMKSLSL